MDDGKILTVFRGQEVDEGISAVIITTGGQTLAARVVDYQVRIQLRFQLHGLAINDNPLSFLQSELENVLPIAVGRSIDGRIERHSLSLRRFVVRLGLCHIRQTTADGKDPGITDAIFPDQSNLVSACRNIMLRRHLKSAGFDHLSRQPRMIKSQRLHVFRIASQDFDFEHAAGAQSQGLDPVKPNRRQFGGGE